MADQAASNNFKNENSTKILFKEKKHNKLSVFTDFFRINTNKFSNKKMRKILLLLSFIFLGLLFCFHVFY